MKIETLVVGQLAANCYLAVCEETGSLAIIDPGDDGEFIVQKILGLKLKPEFIVATHGHFDHILAATELKLAFRIPFYLHQKDLSILKRTQQTAEYFLGISVDPPPKVDKFIKEGDILRFGKEKLAVMETPGHTPGGICLYSNLGGVLFSGDTLFASGGIGRTDLDGSSLKDLINSIKTKLFILPEETLVYPGHGEEATIELAKREQIW